MSSLSPTPWREKMRNPVGLFPLVWSFATADSTFLLCLETQWLAQALWGQGSKINSMHREASAHVRRKAPQQGSVCYSLHQELNSLQALRETIHTNSCCPLSLGSPHKHYHEKSKLKSFGVFGFGVFFLFGLGGFCLFVGIFLISLAGSISLLSFSFMHLRSQTF